jgi:anti-sigma factor RsiW
MEHEVDKEALSAYLDGELADGERRALEAHIAACRPCARHLKRIDAASGDFKRHGGRKTTVPPRARPARWLLGAGMALAAALGMVLLGGAVLKRSMPGLFSQIQGMISGAANTMGSGH